MAWCRHRSQASSCYITTGTISTEDRVQLAFESPLYSRGQVRATSRKKKSKKAFRDGRSGGKDCVDCVSAFISAWCGNQKPQPPHSNRFLFLPPSFSLSLFLIFSYSFTHSLPPRGALGLQLNRTSADISALDVSSFPTLIRSRSL